MRRSLKMSVYRNAEDTERKQVTLEYVVHRIMYGGPYTAVTFSGIFPPGQRSANAIESHTGLIGLHLVNFSVKTIPLILEKLRRRPGIVLVFRPPQAVAVLSCVVRVDPLPRDPAEHVSAFEAAKAHLRDLTHGHRLKIDNRGADCSDLSYIQQDFNHISNYHAIPLIWHRDTPREIQQQVPTVSGDANTDQEHTPTQLHREDLTEAHSIQDFQRVMGCSYEYARQHWHKAGGKKYRESKEAELASRIRRLKEEGHSQRAIAEIVGIKRNKVRRVLKNRRGRNCNTS